MRDRHRLDKMVLKHWFDGCFNLFNVTDNSLNLLAGPTV